MPTYLLQGTASGSWSRLVEADSETEARAKMNDEINADGWDADLETVDDVSVDHCQKIDLT